MVIYIIHTKDKSIVELTENEIEKFHLYAVPHKIDGPAIESKHSRTWWIDGEYYRKSQFDQIIAEIKAMPVELRLTDSRWWVREWK